MTSQCLVETSLDPRLFCPAFFEPLILLRARKSWAEEPGNEASRNCFPGLLPLLHQILTYDLASFPGHALP